MFNNAAAKDNFDLQYAKLMPQLSVQGQVAHYLGSSTPNYTNNYGQVMVVGSMPLYQGGSEYATIRQARQQQQQAEKQIDDARRTAIQQATQYWSAYVSTVATVSSTRQSIRANEVALEGVQREAIVGSRTTQDVLYQEQQLLSARVTLVQNLSTLVTTSYQVASATGRLTARDLSLNVQLYDETAYYQAVKNKWIGTGDYATDQPSR